MRNQLSDRSPVLLTVADVHARARVGTATGGQIWSVMPRGGGKQPRRARSAYSEPEMARRMRPSGNGHATTAT